MKNLDDPQTTIKRRQVLNEKKYLKEVYNYFYKILRANSRNVPKGIRVEIGSGPGFIKKVIPNTITTDVLDLPFCDKCFSAEKIPFKSRSVSVFYMLNTFHHIKNPKKGLLEMQRCLKRKGKVIMIEPANTTFSRFIYKNFHQEPFEEKAGWRIKGRGFLSDANQALPWIIFDRDKEMFKHSFPNLEIIKYENHTPFNYFVSGGFSHPSFFPVSFFGYFKLIEKSLAKFNNTLGSFATIVLRKT